MMTTIVTTVLKVAVPLFFAFFGWIIWCNAMESRRDYALQKGASLEHSAEHLLDLEEFKREERWLLCILVIHGLASLLLLAVAPKACGWLNIILGTAVMVFYLIIAFSGDEFQAEGAFGFYFPFVHWLGVAWITLLIPPLHVLYSVVIYATSLLLGYLLRLIGRRKRTKRAEAETAPPAEKSEEGKVKQAHED